MKAITHNSVQYPNKYVTDVVYDHFSQILSGESRFHVGETLDETSFGKRLLEATDCTFTEIAAMNRKRVDTMLHRAIYHVVGHSETLEFIGGNAKLFTSWNIH